MQYKTNDMSTNTKPIRPDEILDDLINIIPSVVIESVNKLLKEKYRGESVVITQDAIVNEIIANSNLTRNEISEKKYLDFEKLYNDNGWIVGYDKPAYDENYPATFKFTKRK